MRPRRRFFVLTNDVLEWFDDGTPTGVIALEGAMLGREEISGGNELILTSAQGDMLVLRESKDTDRLEDWEKDLYDTGED